MANSHQRSASLTAISSRTVTARASSLSSTRTPPRGSPSTTQGSSLSARLVYVSSGEVLWSGSDVASVYSFEESARSVSDSILKAVKKTWPSSLKR